MTDGIYPVTMPKWGIEMREGTVVGWHVGEGKDIDKGDELIDIETDKIVNTMEAPASGVLRRHLVGEGETLNVGTLLGVVAAAKVDDAAIDAFIAAFEPAETSLSLEDRSATFGSQPPEPAQQQPEPAIASGDPAQKRVRVSPAAAQRARELGVDTSKVQSSGRRISPEDVERHAQQYRDSGSSDVENAAYEARPLSAMRKSIARRLVEAKQQIPHFYLSIDIVMDAALACREEINRQSAQKVSVNDVVLRAVVLALQSVPDVNIHLVQDEIRRFRHINLAIVVATERGLITPVIQQAEALTMAELAKEATALGERARNSALTRVEVENGTFTVSNLGMYGISGFQAIINPPQGAILAVGACDNRVISGTDDIHSAQVMSATLSCDHRAIDGALGAQFLSKLKAILEKPGDL